MIINADEVKNIYVSTHFVDMRKSIDGLTLIVHSQFQMNVLDHSLFIFTNRSRNRIKILYYESNGFWLFIKRLEHGKFKIQESQESLTRAITSRQLSWLLEGLEYDEKLKEKQEQGIKVEIVIFDDGINAKHGVDLEGFDFVKVKAERGGIMHNKFCVIDNQIVITGSYNWSDNAEYKNDENISIQVDPKQATKYSVKFRELRKQKK